MQKVLISVSAGVLAMFLSFFIPAILAGLLGIIAGVSTYIYLESK